jgi:C1A family cysteine protease
MTNIGYVPKLGGWKPDHTMPDNADHVDLLFHDNINMIAGQGASVSNPGVETNGVLDLRHWCSPVENQAKSSSCVGNSVVGGLEFLQIRNGIPFEDLSRLFVYYNSRLMHQQQDKDEGTYIRLAMGTLSSLGTCTEKKWPYDLKTLFTRPSWGSYRDAYPNKIDGYYRIDGTGQSRIDKIKQALTAQHPVVFGMFIDEDYMNVGSDGMIAMPKLVRVGGGGHAQLIVGYNESLKRLIIRNSWGTNWADHGYCYCPYEYLDASNANDIWIPTAVPQHYVP